MSYAIISAGIVQNVVVATPEFAASQGWIACPAEVAPGWTYDGENWTAPPASTPQPVQLSSALDFKRYMAEAFSGGDLATGIMRFNAVWIDTNFAYFRSLIEGTVIGVDWDDVIAGLPLLVALEVITQTEADALVALRPVA
jgi:hypothetical protein